MLHALCVPAVVFTHVGTTPRLRDSVTARPRDPYRPNTWPSSLITALTFCGRSAATSDQLLASSGLRMLKVLLVLALQLPVVESAPSINLQVTNAAWLGSGLALGLVGLGLEVGVRIGLG